MLQELMWNAIGYGVITGSSLVAMLAFYFFAKPARLLPMDRLRPGRWGGHEVFLASCVVIGLPVFVPAVLQWMGFFLPLLGEAPDYKTHPQEAIRYTVRSVFFASPLSMVLALAAVFSFMFARTGTRPHQYGLTWARWRPNLILGLAAAMVATPIVLAVFVGIKLVVPARPEYILDAARSFDAWEWTCFAFHVVIAAPILEEILCRGILQNWLRRASLVGHLGVLGLSLYLAWEGVSYRSAEVVEFDWGPMVFAVVLVGGYGVCLVQLARSYHLTETEIQNWQPDADSDDPRLRAWRDLNAWLAIVGSAIFFAMLHGRAWPAPVPLLLMGLLLGWLAHRTQSLIGPIVYHAVFNLSSLITLYGTVTTQAPG